MRIFLGISLVLASSVASAQNLVANGDFSLGNTGFFSGYSYADPATDALYPENVYTITANTVTPYVLNTHGDGITDYNDHTTGKGLFMAVNGSTTADSLVWAQSLTGLTIGQTYNFSAWVSRWTPGNEASANLRVTVDGNSIAQFNDPDQSGLWIQRTGIFTAASTYADVQIRNFADARRGNDFSLDDISVQAVPEPGMIAAVSLGLLSEVKRRRAMRLAKL